TGNHGKARPSRDCALVGQRSAIQDILSARTAAPVAGGHMLHEFILVNRAELIMRCRAKVGDRSMPSRSDPEVDNGVPLFLDQLATTLRLRLSSSAEIGRTAAQHGHDLLLQGFSVSQVVHAYGDVCQAITELAVETDAPISTDDFRVLNRCLDDAIAGAVTEYGR